MIPTTNIYIKVAMLICLIVSLFFLLELHVFPPRKTTETFEKNYDYTTTTSHDSYSTKILLTANNNKYILPDDFYCVLETGNEIVINKSLIFSWPLSFTFKNSIIPIGLFAYSPTKWVLLSSMILFVFIYFIFYFFRKQIALNNLLGKWLISIPLCLLLVLLYEGFTQTCFI